MATSTYSGGKPMRVAVFDGRMTFFVRSYRFTMDTRHPVMPIHSLSSPWPSAVSGGPTNVDLKLDGVLEEPESKSMQLVARFLAGDLVAARELAFELIFNKE